MNEKLRILGEGYYEKEWKKEWKISLKKKKWNVNDGNCSEKIKWTKIKI